MASLFLVANRKSSDVNMWHRLNLETETCCNILSFFLLRSDADSMERFWCKDDKTTWKTKWRAPIFPKSLKWPTDSWDFVTGNLCEACLFFFVVVLLSLPFMRNINGRLSSRPVRKICRTAGVIRYRVTLMDVAAQSCEGLKGAGLREITRRSVSPQLRSWGHVIGDTGFVCLHCAEVWCSICRLYR